MSKKTINQALKDVFLNLGGDPSELSDNTSVSDYIEDLGGAIEDAAGGAAEAIIDDTASSETKTYSSSKIVSLIPTNELPTPSSSNNGKVATVVSDGEGGYVWSAESPKEGVTYLDITVGGTKASPNVNKNFNQIIDSYFGGKIPRVKLTVSDLSDLNNFEMIFAGYCPARGSDVAYFTFMGYANTGADEVGLVSVKILNTQGWAPSVSITIHTLS